MQRPKWSSFYLQLDPVWSYELFGTGLYLGRAPRTNETLPDFCEWCRVTRHPRVFRGLTGCQRTPREWGVTSYPIHVDTFSTPPNPLIVKGMDSNGQNRRGVTWTEETILDSANTTKMSTIRLINVIGCEDC